MKFIHIADMHLDRSFEGLGKLPNELLEHLVKQNQKMVSQLVDQALKEEVDFVLIVGDTFHQPLVTIQTQHLLIQELERLAEADIPVFLTFGNHDYYLPEKYWFDFPQNVTLFTSAEVETLILTTKIGEQVALSGFSYTERWVPHSKIEEFPQRNPAVDFHLGLYHGEVGSGQTETQHYAPFSMATMKGKAYDYWALGHIHQPTVLSEQPAIIYPGTPLGHTKKEKASQGFVLVEMMREKTEYRWHPLDQVEWREVEVSVGEVADLKSLLIEIESCLLDKLTISRTLSLISLRLVGLNATIDASVQRELANGSLLAHLQATLYQQSQQNAWLFDVKRLVANEELPLPLGVSQALLSQLSHKYLDATSFERLAEDLYRQKALIEVMTPSQEMRTERVVASMNLLQQELGISEDLR